MTVRRDEFGIIKTPRKRRKRLSVQQLFNEEFGTGRYELIECGVITATDHEIQRLAELLGMNTQRVVEHKPTAAPRYNKHGIRVL